jgi:4-hydroxybenzoyl-CoA thioesterase
MGTRSLTLDLHCFDATGETRMRMRQVLVTTSLDSHRAVEIPPALREAIGRSTPAAAA